jgi:hypothetical protein
MDNDSAILAEAERVSLPVGGLRIEPVSYPCPEPVDTPSLRLKMEIERHGPVVGVAADAELHSLVEPGRPKKAEKADFGIGKMLGLKGSVDHAP